jgi:hypothetical protein
MRVLWAVIVLLGFLLLSCSKRPHSQVATDVASSSAPTASLVPAKSPAVAATLSSTPTANPVLAESPAVAATPSEYHRLAPPGVLYLLEYVSLKSDSGVIGFTPGTRLRLIEDKGDTIVVSDGRTKLEVDEDKLTNDLDIAALAANQDVEGQQELADYLGGQRAIDEALHAGQNAVYDQDQRELAAQRAAPKYSNPLERGPYHERGSVRWPRYIYRYDPPKP